MNCLRCGKYLPQGGSFCLDCLATMAKHPVDPKIPAVIPRRLVKAPPPKVRETPPEELLAVARHRLRVVSVAFLVLLLGTIVLSFFTVRFYQEGHRPIGQNYNTSGSAPAPAEGTLVPAVTVPAVTLAPSTKDSNVSRETSPSKP